MDQSSQIPDWSNADSALRIVPGVMGGHDGLPGSEVIIENFGAVRRKSIVKRRQLSIDDYIEGITSGDRTILARAITLIESKIPEHQEIAQNLLANILPLSGKSIRVGITGVPGAGKSTLIEALGTSLCQMGKKVAVLAIDPTSTITYGSILGDKTRMENLSREENAFIRPSPSGGTLGGVAARSRETMILCEASGFDVILIETVGVGQSEVTVRTMVDFFMLVLLPGGGDELQGIKKGVVELADAVVINKSDGENKIRAGIARTEYEKALHYLHPITEGWISRAHTCSAYTGEGVMQLWDLIMDFQSNTFKSGVFDKRRQQQNVSWMKNLCEDQLVRLFYAHPTVAEHMLSIEQNIANGKMMPAHGMKILIEKFLNHPC